MSDPRTMLAGAQEALREQESELNTALGFLGHARCPNTHCDHGVIRSQIAIEEFAVQRCDWCEGVNQLMRNRVMRVAKDAKQ